MKPKTVRAIIKKANKFLLFQRASSDEGGGYYQFAGGNVDEGETPEEAIKRELKEETGLQAVKIKKAFSFISPHHGKTTQYYYVNVKGKVKLQPSEIQNYKWVQKNNDLPLTKGAEIAMRRL